MDFRKLTPQNQLMLFSQLASICKNHDEKKWYNLNRKHMHAELWQNYAVGFLSRKKLKKTPSGWKLPVDSLEEADRIASELFAGMVTDKPKPFPFKP